MNFGFQLNISIPMMMLIGIIVIAVNVIWYMARKHQPLSTDKIRKRLQRKK